MMIKKDFKLIGWQHLSILLKNQIFQDALFAELQTTLLCTVFQGKRHINGSNILINAKKKTILKEYLGFFLIWKIRPSQTLTIKDPLN